MRRRVPTGEIAVGREAGAALTVKNTAMLQHMQPVELDRAKVLRGTVLSADGEIIAELTAALHTNWAKVTDLFHEVSREVASLIEEARSF